MCKINQSKQAMLTHGRIKQLFDYDPSNPSQPLINKVSRGKLRKGANAGCKASNGYYQAVVDGQFYFMHRLVWFWHYGSWPEIIDHVDSNPANNLIENLESVTQAQNLKKKRKQKNNKTGITGVCWNGQVGKYQVYINVDGDRKHLGVIVDFFEACCMRKAAENRAGYHEKHGL